MNFETDKYIQVKNILSPEICKIVTQYALLERDRNKNPEPINSLVPGIHHRYKDNCMQSLLFHLKPMVEHYTKKKLLPTYSYYRVYEAGDTLKMHVDREACEYSTTITIGYKYINKPSKDFKWKLCANVNGKKTYIDFDVGDAIIYKGMELEHGRDRFNVDKGSWQVSVFLHYVDADGPHKDCVNDLNR